MKPKLELLDENALLKQKALAIALLASLLLWNLPFGGLLLYPFKLLATWMHELSHGVVMFITGAGFDYIEIYRDTSGMAHAESAAGPSSAAAIAAAGYMGVPLIGAIMLVIAQTRARARGVLIVLGASMVGTAILFIANTFGITVIAICGAVCLGLAAFPDDRVGTFAVNFIASQACINAVLDIRVLFRSNLVVNGQVMGASDAHNMAKATFGTPWMWALIWLAWSFALFYVALRLAHQRQHVPNIPRARASSVPARDGGPLSS